MKIVLFSDSHGDKNALEQIIAQESDADLFLHLGDGLRELHEIKVERPELTIAGVKGNNDFYFEENNSLTIELFEKRLFFTHGHIFGVKNGLSRIRREAQDMDVSLVAFGHTHKALLTEDNGIFYINPGSASLAFSYANPSYGVIIIDKNEIKPSIVRIDWRNDKK